MKAFIRKIFARILYALNVIFSYLETRLSRESQEPQSSSLIPIFIIGAPRSGSTLLYQVLTAHYDIGYLTNFHCKFWGAPSWAQRLIDPLRWRRETDFQSHHGQTEGIAAPSECGQFWYRFFRRKPQYVPQSEANPLKMAQMGKAVYSLILSINRPLLFKNMNCALRLQPIATALPKALFIVIHRGLVDNAHSLLEVRMKVNGSYDAWWSMEPPNIDELRKLPSHEQVIKQIREIYDLIRCDREKIGESRFLDIDYAEFCRDTGTSLAKLEDFLRKHGVDLKQLADVPSSFQRPTKINIPQELYQKLKAYAANH
ncbi:sulfotransferase [Candidatus Acetothermia bacterium]|nr:sulfotransferase [Candidatus Acetothermia bacterium]MBI3643985.1 sulfotransferase [Candidatus Acetothermia bacterium]